MLTEQPPWRNWLARSAVNRKVGGSSPPGGANFFAIFDKLFLFYQLKRVDLGRTRTCNPLIRSQMPYPLGHKAGLRCCHTNELGVSCQAIFVAIIEERKKESRFYRDLNSDRRIQSPEC